MITSTKNRWLKDMRRLRTSKGRRPHDGPCRLLLEGPHLVRDAAVAGLELEVVLATPEFLAGPTARTLASWLPRPPLAVDAEILDSIADSDSPRGLVAIGLRPWTPLEALPRPPGAIYLFADGLQDPGNVGALARVAEAAGATALLLGRGSAAASHPRALRASAGSLLRLPVVVDADAAAVATVVDAVWIKLRTRDGQSLYQPPGGEPASDRARILAVGAEGAGLSRQVEQLAGYAVTIPTAGEVESLNATVAAALVLFEWRRRHLRAASQDFRLARNETDLEHPGPELSGEPEGG